MQCLTVVNNGENAPQKSRRCNMFAQRDLPNQINNLVFHITRETTGGDKTFTVQGYSFDIFFRALALAMTRFRYLELVA